MEEEATGLRLEESRQERQTREKERKTCKIHS